MRTLEQSKKRRPSDLHDDGRYDDDDDDDDDNNDDDDDDDEEEGKVNIVKATERSARSRSSADTEYFRVS